MTKNFIGEKENMTNKGNDKHEDADSLLHNTRTYTQMFIQNFKILLAVVPHKSDEKFYWRKRKMDK